MHAGTYSKSGIILYLSLCVWIIFLGTVFSRFFGEVACVRISPLSLWLNTTPLYVFCLSTHLLNIWVVSTLNLLNKTSIIVGVKVSV